MVVLVRFGEIALKSRYVRRQLRDRLVANIEELFAWEGLECVTEADEARVYVHSADEARARGVLARVFGVVSTSAAVETPADLELIRRAVLAEAHRCLPPGASFAMRTRRVGTHPFTSQDLAREFGAAVRAAHPGARVDLSEPEVEICVEVRRNRAFVFHEVSPGPGGLPLGSQGRALAIVGDTEGMVAAWMGMKRGCRTAIAAPADGRFVEPLRRWDVRLKVLDLPPWERIDEAVRLARADALFLGTRGADASPGSRPRVSVPVFEPVVGLSSEEIEAIAARIRGA